MATHIIKKQVFDLQMLDEENAFAIQDRVKKLWMEKAMPIIESYCEQHAGAEKVLRFNQVAFAFGEISLAELEANIEQHTRKQLDTLFLQSSSLPDEPLQKANQQQWSKEAHALELIRHFLLTGTLPWWAKGKQNLQEELTAMIDGSPTATKKMFWELLPQTFVRKRLANQFDDQVLKKVVALLTGKQEHFVANVISDLLQLQRQTPFLKLPWTTFRQLSWSSGLVFIMDPVAVQGHKMALIQSLFETYAGSSGKPLKQIVATGVKQVVNNTDAAWQSTLPELLQVLAVELKYPAKNGAQASGDHAAKKQLTQLETMATQQAPELQMEIDQLQDWITCMPVMDKTLQMLLAAWESASSQLAPRQKAALRMLWEKEGGGLLDRVRRGLLWQLFGEMKERLVNSQAKLSILLSADEVVLTGKDGLEPQLLQALLEFKEGEEALNADTDRKLLQQMIDQQPKVNEAQHALLQLLIDGKTFASFEPEEQRQIQQLLETNSNWTAAQKSLLRKAISARHQLTNAEKATLQKLVALPKGYELEQEEVEALQGIHQAASHAMEQVQLLLKPCLDPVIPLSVSDKKVLLKLRHFMAEWKTEDRQEWETLITAGQVAGRTQKTLIWKMYRQALVVLETALAALQTLGKGEEAAFSNAQWKALAQLRKSLPQLNEQQKKVLEFLLKNLPPRATQDAASKQDTVVPATPDKTNAISEPNRSSLVEQVQSLQSTIKEMAAQGRALVNKIERPQSLVAAEERQLLQKLATVGKPLSSSERSAMENWLASDAKIDTDLKASVQKLMAAKTAQKDALKIPWKTEKKVPMEEVFIENAGLVLLNPYLPSFFRNLGLVKGLVFNNEQAAHHAAALLQYLVTGEEEDKAEYDLVLNKLLCGIDLEEPLETGFTMDEKMKAEGHDLLESIVQNWTALKSTSVEGFRGSFLLREGILTREMDGWRLKIERKGWDALLDALPWNIALIKLDWMPKPLHVEW